MTETNYTIVLLVEPERDERDRYQESLRRHGFLTVPVSTAADALAIAPRVDVVVTGILLAGPMDGTELVDRLRTNERTRRLPVIVLTEGAWPADRDRVMAAGCDGFLQKPCEPERLADEIRRALAVRRTPDPQRAPGAAR